MSERKRYSFNFHEVPRRELVISLGIFDGLHLGHQRIINHLRNKASEGGFKSCVFTFYPHPREVLNKVKFRGYIYPLYYRLRLIKSYGIDYSVVLNFKRGIHSWEGREFLKFLCRHFIIKGIVAGKDFKFGYDRISIKRLREELKRENIFLDIIEDVTRDSQRVSSSLIKNLIMHGEFKKVERYLGRPYSIVGLVIKGNLLGKRLGFPTANIYTQGLVLPPEGVYISSVFLEEKEYRGLLSIGRRPTLEKTQSLTTEVHILGYKKSIYNKVIEIRVLKFLRRQKKFPSLEHLRRQILEDIKKATPPSLS